MSLTGFATTEIAPNAEDTLRHVLKSGVNVINTARWLCLSSGCCFFAVCSEWRIALHSSHECHSDVSYLLNDVRAASTGAERMRK